MDTAPSPSLAWPSFNPCLPSSCLQSPDLSLQKDAQVPSALALPLAGSPRHIGANTSGSQSLGTCIPLSQSPNLWLETDLGARIPPFGENHLITHVHRSGFFFFLKGILFVWGFWSLK